MYVVYDMPWSVQIEDQSSLQVTWNEQALHSCVLSAGFTLKNGGPMVRAVSDSYNWDQRPKDWVKILMVRGGFLSHRRSPKDPQKYGFNTKS